MSHTLFDLEGIFRDIYEMDISDETKRDTLEAMDWESDFEKKLESYVKVIRTLEHDIKAIEEEYKRLADKKRALKNKIDYLKSVMQSAMETTGHDKVKTALFSISLAYNRPSVVVDEEKLATKYKIKTVTVKPDKQLIYEMLQSGKKVRGASLQQTRSVRIR